ncbi:MAG TPA: hypothetical protein PLK58_12280 [Candidatus Rifleibacterium sp.]|nr:hypothetical protein [Candidatus Rifleibacterium sp.]
MNQLDLLLKNSLAGLAAGYDDSAAEVSAESVKFASVAFFRESGWKPCSWYRNAREHGRASHPGLSVAKTRNQIAFGSSSLEGRDPQTTLFVSPNECQILGKKTAFLLQYSAPLSVFDVDYSRTSVADISPALKDELERKLAGV